MAEIVEGAIFWAIAGVVLGIMYALFTDDDDDEEDSVWLKQLEWENKLLEERTRDLRRMNAERHRLEAEFRPAEGNSNWIEEGF